jgi:IS30 family transposase
LAERREIYRMRSAQIPVPVIAQRLGHHPSTIYREISRNWMHDEKPLYQGYFHVAADMQARARRQRLGKLSRHPALAVHVIDCLKAAWSLEQIAGRLRVSGAPERISHETIYRFVYSSQSNSSGCPRNCPRHGADGEPATSASRAVSSSRRATPSSSVHRRSQLAPASATGRAT